MHAQLKTLYLKRIEGARVHSKAVRIFGTAPEKPTRQLFREAVSGAEKTPRVS